MEVMYNPADNFATSDSKGKCLTSVAPTTDWTSIIFIVHPKMLGRYVLERSYIVEHRRLVEYGSMLGQTSTNNRLISVAHHSLRMILRFNGQWTILHHTSADL
jgi:hypothetical protein